MRVKVRGRVGIWAIANARFRLGLVFRLGLGLEQFLSVDLGIELS